MNKETTPSTVPAIFMFGSTKVRIITDALDNPWWVAKDAAAILGYKDTINAIKRHCRGVAKRHPIPDSLGRPQLARIINEPDLLRLISGSRLPEAVRFEQWIFENVLPTIRKTGGYVHPAAPSIPSDTMITAKEIPPGYVLMPVKYIEMSEKIIRIQDENIRLLKSAKSKKRIHKPLKTEEKDQVLSLAAAGLGPFQIGKRMGRAKSTIAYFLKLHKKAVN